MLYAKAIHSEQIVTDINEFRQRTELYKTQGYPYHNVYMLNRATIDDCINCVPLNYIFAVMKYGDVCAILLTPEELLSLPYSNQHSVGRVTENWTRQIPIEFLNLNSIEGLQRIFELIGDLSTIYEHCYDDKYKKLYPEVYEYYTKRIKSFQRANTHFFES